MQPEVSDPLLQLSVPAVPKMCSADPKGIRGYISVMATLKFTYCCKGIMFVNNYRVTSLIGYMLIAYERYNIAQGAGGETCWKETTCKTQA